MVHNSCHVITILSYKKQQPGDMWPSHNVQSWIRDITTFWDEGMCTSYTFSGETGLCRFSEWLIRFCRWNKPSSSCNDDWQHVWQIPAVELFSDILCVHHCYSYDRFFWTTKQEINVRFQQRPCLQQILMWQTGCILHPRVLWAMKKKCCFSINTAPSISRKPSQG